MSNRPDIVEELEIAAPAEVVWRALTEADELTNWFPLSAKVVPGKSIELDWGPPWDWKQDVEIWDPLNRLRTVFAGQTLDITLESSAGSTKVRLVHSGFDVKEDWEAEHYEGTVDGWAFETQSLKHYLERHRGVKRIAVWPRVRTTRSKEEAFAVLFAAIGSPPGEGLVQARVIHNNPPMTWAAIAANWNDGILRIGVGTLPGGRAIEAGIWLSAWGVAEDRVRAFERDWTRELEARLAA